MKNVFVELIAISSLCFTVGAEAHAGPPPPQPSTKFLYAHVINNYMMVSENVISSSNMQGPGDYYVYGGASQELTAVAPANSTDSYYTFALSAKGPQAPGACILKFDFKAPDTTSFTLVKQSDGSQGFFCSMNTNYVTINQLS